MLALASALSLALLTRSAIALPTPRDDPQTDEHSADKLMNQMISQLLDQMKVNDKTLFVPNSAWVPIDFIGSNINITENQKYQYMVNQIDQVSNSTSELFSNDFVRYLHDANMAMNIPNATDSSELTSSSNNQDQKCDKGVADGRKLAMTQYEEANGVAPKGPTDPDFISWAAVHSAAYSTAQTTCQASENDHSQTVDEELGTAWATFARALDLVGALAAVPRVYKLGVTLPVSDSGPAGSQDNVFVADYQIPTLEQTVNNWIAGAGLGGGFDYNSAESTETDSSKTTFGGGGITFNWRLVSVSGSGSGSKTTNNADYSMNAVSVHFAAVELVQIETGLWFDKWDTAAILRNAKSDDPKLSKGIPVFNNYFGTKEQPGQLAIINDLMLVGYNPSVTMTFESKDAWSEHQERSASAGFCIGGVLCLGGNGGMKQDDAHSNETSLTSTWSDPNQLAYNLGYVQKRFWDKP